MEAFLSNKEILPFVLTVDIEVREEQMQKKIPSRVKAFWSREPVDVLLLLKRKSTFSFRKGTNIKHGPFSSVVEHGKKEEMDRKYTTGLHEFAVGTSTASLKERKRILFTF